MSSSVKVRKVGDSLVVTLTKPVADEASIGEGDSLRLETIRKGRVLIRKEGEPVAVQEKVELELEILEKRRAALAAELELAVHEHNNSMPTAHPGIEDNLIMQGVVRETNWRIAQLDVGIAEKRLELLQVE